MTKRISFEGAADVSGFSFSPSAWFSGSAPDFWELHALRKQILVRSNGVTHRLRRLVIFALILVLAISFLGTYALADSGRTVEKAGVLFVFSLLTICALIVSGVHILEMHLSDMVDYGHYVAVLQKHLVNIQLHVPSAELDPIARLILKEARQLQVALSEQRLLRPALLGDGLRLGHR